MMPPVAVGNRVVWHGTPASNLPSILSQGLRRSRATSRDINTFLHKYGESVQSVPSWIYEFALISQEEAPGCIFVTRYRGEAIEQSQASREKFAVTLANYRLWKKGWYSDTGTLIKSVKTTALSHEFDQIMRRAALETTDRKSAILRLLVPVDWFGADPTIWEIGEVVVHDIPPARILSSALVPYSSYIMIDVLERVTGRRR